MTKEAWPRAIPGFSEAQTNRSGKSENSDEVFEMLQITLVKQIVTELRWVASA